MRAGAVKAFETDGFLRLPFDPRVAAWAEAAHWVAMGLEAEELRHGGTWQVGVDVLPNAEDGSIDGVALQGAWEGLIAPPKTWHRAQVSVVHPGYPRQDPDESDAAHRYRLNRDAAHVDGLLPEGPDRRRHLREPHAFVLGLPLNDVLGSPLVVWRGSHWIVQRAFVAVFSGVPAETWGDVDVTDIYQAARREAFETCERIELPAKPGEATLLNRHIVHGVAPWRAEVAPPEGRMIAYFRPQLQDVRSWI